MPFDPSQVFSATSQPQQQQVINPQQLSQFNTLGTSTQQPQQTSRLGGFFRMNNAPGSTSASGDAIHAISQGEHYLDPSFAAGTLALPHYMRTLSSLTRHPTKLENQIMGSYTASPTAQYEEQNLQQTAGQQAGQGGQIGTPDEEIALQKQEQGIVAKDQQQYYNDAMKPFEMGLSGEQYLTGMGLKAGEGISQGQDQIAHTYMSQEAIDNAQQALKDKEESSTFSSLLGAAGAIPAIASMFA